MTTHSRTRRFYAAVLLAVSSLLLPAATASASTPSAGVDSQFENLFQPGATPAQIAARKSVPIEVKAAVLRIAAGSTSTSDLETAVLYQDLASAASAAAPGGSDTSALFVGPVRLGAATARSATTNGLAVTGSSTPSLASAAVYCRWFEGWWTHTSTFGHVAYRWGQHLDVCYNGSAVTSINSRYHFVRDRDSLFYDRGLVANSVGSVGSWQLQSYMRGSMENCILRYGCLGTYYPSTSITAYGNGTAGISSTES